MKTEITKDELEKVKVLNLLMWLQASIYAGDECETIKWFYNHQTFCGFVSGYEALACASGSLHKTAVMRMCGGYLAQNLV